MKKKDIKKFSDKLTKLNEQLNFNNTIPKIRYRKQTKLASRLYLSKTLDQNTDLINTIESQLKLDLKRIDETLHSK
ncbi:hypothetical protein [Vagococcus fessus]|uniref:Uncharacterized protein n=1 Tax=Vagococcus fessus TaxID=120370 RepID=A0A430A553_9ENTE|nr:hypothetical protein [Vagococcus fessus]RSU01927.1 hypothetical protein CBF31_09155 [Vagococcus fessus]